MEFFKKEGDLLAADFKFTDFIEAFSFMNKVAFWAEKQNHHPNWSNVYNSVHIELCTHDAGDVVTEKDYKLAEKIEELYKS